MTLIVRNLEDEDLHMFSGESSSLRKLLIGYVKLTDFLLNLRGGGGRRCDH